MYVYIRAIFHGYFSESQAIVIDVSIVSIGGKKSRGRNAVNFTRVFFSTYVIFVTYNRKQRSKSRCVSVS